MRKAAGSNGYVTEGQNQEGERERGSCEHVMLVLLWVAVC